MVADVFMQVYLKFKLHFYQEIFARFQNREASLTTVETFCMESIQAMRSPTINEFANFLKISPPNAAYKVNCLIKKGYLNKVQSQNDKREYHLEITQKYMDYYDISNRYVKLVMGRIDERFTSEQRQLFEHMLTVICQELMPEVTLPLRADERPTPATP